MVCRKMIKNDKNSRKWRKMEIKNKNSKKWQKMAKNGKK